jgi:KilA-N domain
MLKVLQYQSAYQITFSINGGDVIVNATEMAKPFKKSPTHFLRNQSTKEYIQALSEWYVNLHSQSDQEDNCLLGNKEADRGVNSRLVKVVHGGCNNGTWLHQKIALRFAQWLSPHFAIWVDEKLEELLTTGRTEIVPASPLDLAEQMLVAMRSQAARLNAVETDVLEVKAKVTAINEDYYTLSGYYMLKDRRFDLTTTEAQQMGRRLSQQSRVNGYTVNRTYHAKYGSVGTYHKNVLRTVLGF